MHAAQLRHGDVGLIDEHEEVFGEVVQQRPRGITGVTPVEMAAIVLDALAVAGLAQHLQVEPGALQQALRFEQLTLVLQHGDVLVELRLDALDGLFNALHRRHEVARRIDIDRLPRIQNLTGKRIDLDDAVYFVAKEVYAYRRVAIRREYIEYVALHPIRAPLEIHVVPLVLNVVQMPQHVLAAVLLANVQRYDHLPVVVGRAHAVDAGDARDDDDIRPLHERPCGREPELLYLLVDVRVLLNIGIRAREVRLGLVVVVVGDEVLDRILRKEVPKLGKKLRGQGLVGGKNKRRLLNRLDDPGHSKRLTGSGYAEKGLERVFGTAPTDQLVNRPGADRRAALGLLPSETEACPVSQERMRSASEAKHGVRHDGRQLCAPLRV